MRRTAAEKYALIRLVEGSELPVRQTLRELRINRSTFYPGFPIWLWYLTARTSRRAVISGVPTQGTHHGG